ncbi:hypothetical protein B0T14DRAFT_45004 [Immersiella caudata]|uniref:Uncharacterized protein n=1 Tax=Immersiella caudata TaxID=314043 RepID=A0AA40CCY2_9PEZI|nr:hypothetical protein B0T14DRAFT_45004 [Immersiella caudata]
MCPKGIGRGLDFDFAFYGEGKPRGSPLGTRVSFRQRGPCIKRGYHGECKRRKPSVNMRYRCWKCKTNPCPSTCVTTSTPVATSTTTEDKLRFNYDNRDKFVLTTTTTTSFAPTTTTTTTITSTTTTTTTTPVTQECPLGTGVAYRNQAWGNQYSTPLAISEGQVIALVGTWIYGSTTRFGALVALFVFPTALAPILQGQRSARGT